MATNDPAYADQARDALRELEGSLELAYDAEELAYGNFVERNEPPADLKYKG